MLAIENAVRVLENLQTGLSHLGLQAAEQGRVAAVLGVPQEAGMCSVHGCCVWR